MSEPDKSEEIRREMEALRSQVDQQATRLRSDVRRLTDWRYYLRQYPWAVAGAAAAIGYLLVPRRPKVVRPDAKELIDLIRRNKVVVRPKGSARGAGLGGKLFGLITRTATRTAIGLATAKLGQIFGERTAEEADSAKKKSPGAVDDVQTGAGEPREANSARAAS